MATAQREFPSRAAEWVEEPVQFGEGGRLFGVLTLPREPHRSSRVRPAFVVLNSGLLHRVGPSRLHVRLARQLATHGFTTFRVDLSGRGDSPKRPGLTSQQSVGADYLEIVQLLDARIGPVPRILLGICSGADNAVRLAIGDEQVAGVVLLDPIAFPDSLFHARRIVAKYTTPARYLAKVKRISSQLAAVGRGEWTGDGNADALGLRDLPTMDQMRQVVELLRSRKGRMLSVFTNYAVGLNYYNKVGQLSAGLGIARPDEVSTEVLWDDVTHTYALEAHRRRLIDTIDAWAGKFFG